MEKCGVGKFSGAIEIARLLAEGPQVSCGAHVEFVIRDRGRGRDAFAEFVSGQHVQGVRRFNDSDVAARGGEINFPVRRDWRGPILAVGIEAFLFVERFAGLAR